MTDPWRYHYYKPSNTTRKSIHAVHDVYPDFLCGSRYHEDMVETFDLDPDKF
jgi:hypothetical protein